MYWVSKATNGFHIATDSIIPELASASKVQLEVKEGRGGKIIALDLVCENYSHMIGTDPIKSFRIGLTHDQDITIS